MRLTLAELATHKVFAQFSNGDTVNITVYDRTNLTTPVLTSSLCSEIESTGIFEWSFSNLSSQPTSLTQYVWVMDNTSTTQTGTLEAGGYPDTLDELIANPSGVVAVETPWVVGNLPAGGTVAIRVFDSTGVEEVLTTNVCTEFISGYYRWSTSNMSVYPASVGSYMWIMTDSISGRTTWGITPIGTPEDIADVVWDAARADHVDVDSFGEKVFADVIEISGDATAADNLESQFDGDGITGDTFPARQDQLDNLVIVGSAVKSVSDSFTLTAGSEVSGTYESTHQYDGVIHQLADTAGTMDGYYEFDIGPEGIPVEVTLFAAVTGNNDYIDIYGYIWGTTSWAKMGRILGGPATTPVEKQFSLLSSMVGIGANLGKVRVRVYGTGLSSANFYNDFMTVSYSINRQTVGYSDGAVWVKATGVSGTTPYINGVADNPCPWADAVVIAAALGLSRFRVVSGESVTLAAGSSESVVIGKNWSLDLNGQDVTDAYVDGARVSGVGTSTGSAVIMEHCGLGAVSLPACRLYQCGIGRASGAFSASQAGQFNLIDCFSLIPGAGTPSLDFSGTGATTGINIRRWSGGSNITMDADCVLSLEVVTGGGQTIDLGGGAAEIRGICRSLTLTLAAGAVAQFSGITGPVEVRGTGGTVRLYGVVGVVTDSSGGAVAIVNEAVSIDNVNAEALDALTSYDVATGTDVSDAETALEAAIPGLVWDESIGDHVAAGTTGKAASDILAETTETNNKLTTGSKGPRPVKYD